MERDNMCKCYNCEIEEGVVDAVANYGSSPKIKKVCERCAHRLPHCEFCGRVIPSIVNQKIDGHYICGFCQEDHIHKCNICGRAVVGEDKYCTHCAVDQFIHSYSFKPEPNFFIHDVADDTNMYMGVELEMNFDRVSDFKKFLEKYTNNSFVYLKHDGSIGEYGVEIVSHPATFKYHIHTDFWNRLFENFKKTNTLGCGLHFHLSKIGFTDEEIEFLDYFVNNFSYIITQIGSRALKDYCKVHKFKHYGSNRWGSHTDACNLSNRDTVELRFCKSTHNYHSFMKKLKNIYVLVQFVKCICANNAMKECMKEENKKKVEDYFNFFKGEVLSRI